MAAPTVPPPQMSSQPLVEHATPAQTVSNQFVSQFYTVLHTSPRNLHRFYSEASTLTLADTRPNGQHIVKTVMGQKSIHEMVMNQGLEDTVTEVYSVDSQYSLNGGVVVQVTGTQSNKGGPKRPFVQTFFLAVQEKGFFVMNDMFRYLPDFRLLPGVENGYPAAAAPIMPQVSKANGIAALAPPAPGAAMGMAAVPPMMAPAPMPAPMPVPPVVPGPHPMAPPHMPMPVPPAAAAVVAPPPPAAAVAPPPAAAVLPSQQSSPPQVPPQQPVLAPQEQQQPQQQQQAQQQQQPLKPVETNKAAEPGVPLSYAERLKQGKVSVPSSPTKQPAAAAAPAAPAAAAPATAPQPFAAAPRAQEPAAAAPAAAGVPAAAAGMERSASQSGSEAGGGPMEAPAGNSVFVRDIPASVTIEELVAKLSQFGPLRPNGVNLKTQRGKDSYAFVDFETVEAAQACMEQGLDFDGHRVNVVEKKPMIFRGGMRGGRGGPPTGYSGRGERGGYRGGRGGRGPYQGSGGAPMMMGRPPMGGPMGPPPMRGRGDGGRMRYDDRGRGRGPRPPTMPVV